MKINPEAEMMGTVTRRSLVLGKSPVTCRLAEISLFPFRAKLKSNQLIHDSYWDITRGLAYEWTSVMDVSVSILDIGCVWRLTLDRKHAWVFGNNDTTSCTILVPTEFRSDELGTSAGEAELCSSLRVSTPFLFIAKHMRGGSGLIWRRNFNRKRFRCGN